MGFGTENNSKPQTWNLDMSGQGSLAEKANPHLATTSLQVSEESNKCKFQERRGEKVLSSAEIPEPWNCLNRFVEQVHLHALCTFLFQESAYVDCSCYALPKYLGVIQGNDLDCCRLLSKSLISSLGAPLGTARSSQVSPEPSLLQAEHSQLFQPGSRAEEIQSKTIHIHRSKKGGSPKPGVFKVHVTPGLNHPGPHLLGRRVPYVNPV
ncbi:hypothetical protein TURU_137842 [Turdus rufiventris]|nr:hypothetical protein TURU_137842 [Turdus rufiventris]